MSETTLRSVNTRIRAMMRLGLDLGFTSEDKSYMIELLAEQKRLEIAAAATVFLDQNRVEQTPRLRKRHAKRHKR